MDSNDILLQGLDSTVSFMCVCVCEWCEDIVDDLLLLLLLRDDEK